MVANLLPDYLRWLERLGVDPPIGVLLSLLGVQGARMAVSQSGYMVPEGDAIERDPLLVPEVILDDFHANITQAMRPALDTVWNAAGWPQSLNYDWDGSWLPRL